MVRRIEITVEKQICQGEVPDYWIARARWKDIEKPSDIHEPWVEGYAHVFNDCEHAVRLARQGAEEAKYG